MKNNPLRLWTVLTLCLCLFSSCGNVPETGSHQPVNGLPDSIGDVLVFKDGSLLKSDGSLFAPDVYDPAAPSPLYTADYAFSPASGRLLYEDTAGVLWLTDGRSRRKIGENVFSWHTAAELSSVAFTLADQGSDVYGSLFLFDDGIITPVDADVLLASVRFSQDGSVLFYEKPHGQTSRLFAFADGKKSLRAEDALPLLWVSDDGSACVTGQADGSAYLYRFYARDFKKSLTVYGAAEAAVSEDQRFVWLRTQGGLLKAISLDNLKDKTVAENVSAFSVSSVTHNGRGAVYLVCDNEDQELYSLYYTDVSGANVRLMHAASADAASRVALNNVNNAGYAVSGDGSRTNGQLCRIGITKDGLTSQTLDTGTVALPTYYESSDTLLYVKDVSVSDGTLFLCDGSSVRALGTVGLIYENGSPCPAAQASKDGQSVFLAHAVTEQTVGLESVWVGDPVIVSDNAERMLGTDWVLSSLWAPAMTGDFSVIYGLALSDDGLILHKVTDSEDTVLFSGVDGFLTVN